MRFALACLVLAACGGGSSSSSGDDVAIDDAAIDAAPTQTAVVVSMMATRTLDTAYYGVNTADSTLHVEIIKGGAAGCPDMDSPTPDYTLLIGSLDTIQSTGAGTFLDYIGDMLPESTVYETATAFTVTAVTKQDGAWVSFDLSGTFPSGTANGHVYATHCASLDG